jgi:polygalacturonase
MKQVIFGKSLLIAVATALVACAGAAQGAALDLQREIDAAAERGGGTVCVPVGEYEVKPFELKSNVTLELAFGARILASTNIADYATRGECPVFIYADHATNVAIVGKGTIDGRGSAFKETAKLRGEDQPKTLPLLMRFSRCRNVRLEGFHYTNPGSWACHLRNCDGVAVKGTSCYNYCNKMNDGLDIESCNVTVEDCDFYADDDSFCFKAESDKTFPVTNVVVRNCRMGSTCNAIKFGTGSYNAFRDITIENCELRRSPGSSRFNWQKRGMPGVTNRCCGIAGLALEVVDGGRMENVTIRNIKMEGYMTPIFIRHSNRHGPKDKGDTYLRNILVENVTGTCDSRISSSITGVPARDGMPARRPRNITLRNISIVAPGGGMETDAAAQVPEKDEKYPEAFMFDSMPLPAYGFYVRHADDVRFENVKVETATPDARPEFYMEDCSRSETTVALKKRLLPDADKFLAYNAVLAEFSAADKAADDAWRTLKSREEYDARSRELRTKMAEAVGGIDFERTPLNAKVLDCVVRDGYRVEKVVFESRPGVYVTGLVFLPDEAKFKPPYRGILLTCGHSANGKGSDAYQRGAVMGALAGFAVFIYDPFAQGERAVGNGHDACSQHNRYGALAALLGQGMARQRIRDGIRAIDYLLSRADVMKGGVGCMGNSGGGTMTALLEALDPRVVAACPSCYISSLRTVVPSTSGKDISQVGDAEQNVFGQLSFGLNHAGYVLMGANAVRMHCCHKDFFPIAGSRETYAVVQDVVRNCGLDARRYGMTDVAGRHGWKESLRASSIQWMRRWLAGDETVPEIDVEAMRRLDVGFDLKAVDHGLDGKESNVTPDGRVDRLPGFKSIFDYLQDDLAVAEKSRPARDAAATADVVCRRAGIRPLDSIGVSVSETAAPQRLSDGVTILREVYSFGDGQKVPAVTFLPKGKAKGAVLVVDDRADRGIHRMRVTQTLAEGKAITVADLAGTGETGAMYRRAWQGTNTPDEVPAIMLYMLGKSMVGVRAEEMIALADATRRRLGLRTEIVAHGKVAIAAAHAYAARRDLFAGISCCHTPQSWADSVRKGEFLPFASIVNGALLDYDWTDLTNPTD